MPTFPTAAALLIALLYLPQATEAQAQAPPQAQAQAQAQVQAQEQEQSRGELLYRTHCAQCHTSQMHWREKKTVRDWPSLRAQVMFWQAQARLGWGEEDITLVARYLNAAYYRLAQPPDAKTAGARPDAHAGATLPLITGQ